METVNGRTDNGKLIISLIGRINSANAAETEAAIGGLRAQNPGCGLLLDAEKLEYISSAGLRIILRLSKDDPDLKIVNVTSEVYEIFEMTGFAEMLTIEKAYRHLSVDGCEQIGQGANGIVYRLDPDTIIKVYRDPNSLPAIKRERELAHKAFVLGIPTAIPYDVVRVGDSFGSVFELLNAKSFSKLINAEPDKIDTYIGYYVDLLKKIHGTEVQPGEMPDMKAVAVDWANFLKEYLTKEQGEKLVSLISAVPDRHTMIHGDYHIKNIMMQNGEVLLIDMDTLSTGHPIFEFASMYLGFVGFGECDPTVVEKFLGIPYPSAVYFFDKSLRLYLGTGDEEQARKVREKSMIVGCTRLMRRTIRRGGLDTEDGRKIIGMCRAHLEDLLGRVDSLDF